MIGRDGHYHICDEPGCDHEGMECFLPDAGKTFDYFCGEHAWANGYCPGCGAFWSGVEAFDFSLSHLCPNCASELEGDEEQDEYDYPEDIP